MTESVITDFQQTGECTIDTQAVMEQWEGNSAISQWHETYTLVSEGENGRMKITISKKQAHELIGSLDLVREQSTVFKNGVTWKKQK